MDLFRCRDKDGIDIVCYRNTWINHIVQQHPEMNGKEILVKAVIENPDEIYQDSTWPDTRNIYNPAVLPEPFDKYYLKICLEYRVNFGGKKRGYVKTAFACLRIKKGDILIWKRESR